MIPTIISLLLVSIILFIYTQTDVLRITCYTITMPSLPSEFEGFVITALSDLHSTAFGKGNRRLKRAVDRCDADVVVMLGDMIDSSHNNAEQVLNSLSSIAESYDCYWIHGNHEQRLANKRAVRLSALEQKIRQTGILPLVNDHVELTRGDANINLYGLVPNLCYYSSIYDYQNKPYTLDVKEFLGESEDSTVNILLSHSPDHIKEYSSWGADLILSGHIHGGIIRVPGKGGLISPSTGLWPQIDYGYYMSGDSQMVVSGGLGCSHIKFRLFNQPEVVKITLQSP